MTRDDDLFGDALEFPASARSAYLGRACAGDEAQRLRVEALLALHDEASGFLHVPLTTRGVDPPAEKPIDRVGRYKLLQKIGEGGCGVVWLAEQESPVRRRVALKVIKLGMDTNAVIARFEAERQALAMMDHPNIARVFDGGATDAGRPYFVMELVRGVRITEYCDDAGLSTRARLELFIQVCQAIQHAHQKGIIHRDIKPSNILVTVNDGVAVPKVIDFGIAKAIEGRLTDKTLVTQFAALIGTPSYMSPEQTVMTSVDVDTRSDIYSLGALLYEMLAGRTPFDATELLASGLDEMRKTILEREPVRPSTRLSTLDGEDLTTTAKRRSTDSSKLLSELHGDLDWIVMKCLEKDRARRYQTANSLSADLKRHLNDEAVTARPPSRVYLLQKLVRRHRVAVGAATAIATVLVLAAAVSSWQAVRATRAERVAERGEREQARLRETESNLRKNAEVQSLASRRRAYASDMHRVQQALATDNFGLAQELLNRQRPRQGESDLRGWEWRYLWQFCRSDSTAVISSKANGFAISSDGEWLVSSHMRPAAVKLWNLRTRQPRDVPLPADVQFPWVAISPREPLLAIGWTPEQGPASGKGRIRLWNYATQQTVNEWSVDGRTGQLRIADDGQTIQNWANREKTSTWRIPTGELLQRGPSLGGSAVITNDLRLAADFENGMIRVTDVLAGKERWRVPAPGGGINRLAFSPDQKLLATSHTVRAPAANLWDEDAGVVALWEVETGREVGRLEGHRAEVTKLVFWPDGKTLATAGMDQTIRIWDVASQRLIRVLRGHTSVITAMGLLPDLTTLVSSSAFDGTLRFWDATAPRSSSHIQIEPNLRPSASWRFSADSRSVVAIDAAGTVQRFGGRDFRERSPLIVSTRGSSEAGRGPLPTSQVKGQLTAASFGEGDAGSATRRASQSEGQLAASLLEQSDTLFASDVPLVAHADPKGVVRIWNWESASLVREFTTLPGQTFPQAFREGGAKLLLAYESTDPAQRGLYEWDVATGAQTRFWPRPAVVGNYVVSPDGRQCLVRPVDPGPLHIFDHAFVRPNPGGCSLIDLVSGVERKLAGVLAGDDPASFSPDGRFFAAPLGLSTSIWETQTFQPVNALTGSLRRVGGALFSPDGHRLVVATTGDSFRIWDAEGWEQVLTLSVPGARFASLEFSPDGNLLGAMNVFGQFHLWRAPSWAEIEAAEQASAAR
ncbi:MAG: serine/threonine-protein kinase [Opitutaceae bacterium]